MTLDDLVSLYIAGAVITGLGDRHNSHALRRMLLWPVFWCYCLALFLIEVRNWMAELRRRHW